MANLLTGIAPKGSATTITRYNMVVTNGVETLFVSEKTSARKTKSALVKMLQSNGDDIFNLVGDGEISWDSRSKTFVFTGDKGTFYAKFLCV